MFYLLTEGTGFTDQGVYSMPMDEMIWMVKRLNKRITDRNNDIANAQRAAMSRAAAASHRR